MSSPTPPAPNELLVFHGTLTEDDCVHLHRARRGIILRPSFQWFLRGLAAALAALMIWTMIDRGPNIVAMGIAVVCVYAAVLLPYHQERYVRRYYRLFHNFYLETEVRLTPERVVVDNPDLKTDCDWRRISCVTETIDGILFCAAHYEPLFWLPQRLFAHDDTLRERVLTLARNCGVRVRRL